jgi:predicted lysophospholipase L1 biosynthesis ABC-type transport system permease subunit
MRNFGLYFTYAWRSFKRGGQRSLLAVLCIAVGVAAIVALQSTGLAISERVAGDARASAQSDIIVHSQQRLFQPDEVAKLETLKQNKTIVDYTVSNGFFSLEVKKPDGTKSNDFGSIYTPIAVEPSKYPFYGKLDMAEPAGKNLKEVLTQPGQMVVDNKMATSLAVKVGDQVTGRGENGQLKLQVVGILNKNTFLPVSGDDPELTGYAYVTFDTLKQLLGPVEALPETILVKTASTPAANQLAKAALQALSPAYAVETASELNDAIQTSNQQFSTVLSYVGLVSLLIGSLGVVNTMLVAVGRRSTEIATIKTLGMESQQAVLVFVIEAAIFGFLGSLIGVGLGELLALVMTQVAQGLVFQSLDFNFYWQPVIMGVTTGIATAVIFGILPAYSASKIPPAQVLRQKSNALPRISRLATLFIIGVMTLLMGLLAGVILGGQFLIGLIVAFATLIVCSLGVLFFSFILWVVGRIALPLGLSYKLARRNLSRSRTQNATTLLVMSVGIFSIALVIILAGSLKDTLKDTIEKAFGYNIILTPQNEADASDIVKLLDARQVPGLQKYNIQAGSFVKLVSAGGVSAEDLIINHPGGPALSFLRGFSASEAANFARIDQGQMYANDNEVLIDRQTAESYRLKPGDKLVFQPFDTSPPFTLTISGTYDKKNQINLLGTLATTPGRVQTIPGHRTNFNLNIEKEQVSAALNYLETKFSNSTITDLSSYTAVISNLIDTIAAFPILLALLSLISGAVLIANNVALAVLERRTEMGVMKSIGAESGRVLSIINWETCIIGFLGGLIGFGLSAGIASILVALLGTAENPAVLSISPLVFIGMLALAIALSLVATVGSAWGAAQEKPLVVLRYE